MAEREFEVCKWIDEDIFYTELDKIRNRYNLDMSDIIAFCGTEDQQFVDFNLIRCVPLELIEEQEAWNPSRLERVREWATKATLMAIPYERVHQKVKARSLPILSRRIDMDKLAQNNVLYEITDGIHRIARARELADEKYAEFEKVINASDLPEDVKEFIRQKLSGLPCILAEVTEELKYTKAIQDQLIQKKAGDTFY